MKEVLCRPAEWINDKVNKRVPEKINTVNNFQVGEISDVNQDDMSGHSNSNSKRETKSKDGKLTAFQLKWKRAQKVVKQRVDMKSIPMRRKMYKEEENTHSGNDSPVDFEMQRNPVRRNADKTNVTINTDNSETAHLTTQSTSTYDNLQSVTVASQINNNTVNLMSSKCAARDDTQESKESRTQHGKHYLYGSYLKSTPTNCKIGELNVRPSGQSKSAVGCSQEILSVTAMRQGVLDTKKLPTKPMMAVEPITVCQG